MLPRMFFRAARGLPVSRRCLSTLCLRQRSSSLRLPLAQSPLSSPLGLTPARAYSSGKSIADERIEEITEQYATARDEFEIAAEETEKKTVYAAEDRAAATEEFAALKQMYDTALRDCPEEVAAEIKSRVGQRIRELDEALKGLEEKAKED